MSMAEPLSPRHRRLPSEPLDNSDWDQFVDIVEDFSAAAEGADGYSFRARWCCESWGKYLPNLFDPATERDKSAMESNVKSHAMQTMNKRAS
eukprot:766345-Hanusia_phi.AAC.2